MRFQFFPLRFAFVAKDLLYFPPGKAANILRGAFGVIFRRLACVPGCPGARQCDARHTCSYARVFEPSAQGDGPSGLLDWPRPFVFRARHLDGLTLQPGQSFHFDLNVFSLEPGVLSCFVLTFVELVSEGLGPRRGKAELLEVRQLAVGGTPEQILYEGSSRQLAAALEPASLGFDPLFPAPPKIRVEFLSPTELKHEQKIAGYPEFAILFARIRDRLSTLRDLYGPGPLDIDFEAIGIRARRVLMTHCDVHQEHAGRQSTRTGQSHSIGGFVGSAEYQGELAEFLPYLDAACWTGVGRQAVWGKGEIRWAAAQLVSSS